MSISAATLAGFEGLLNQLIRLDPEAQKRLAPLHGRVICIALSGFDITVYLIAENKGFQLLGQYEGEADCTIRGSPLALARMREETSKADQVFAGEVAIEGDAVLAQQFHDFILKLDIDWEEQLSKLTGDVIAHEAGNMVRSLYDCGEDLAKTSEQNLQEYLQEELRVLPNRHEIEPFLQQIDATRDAAERLAVRIKRLEEKLSSAGIKR